MKKLTLILFLVFAVNTYAQWVQVPAFPSGRYSRLLNFNGAVLAGGHNVFKSIDEGLTWTVYYQQPFPNDISALSNVDGNVWLSSFYTNVYTTNNGLNWINVNLNKYVYDFAFYNGRIFAGTESWRCFYSTNMGLNWTVCDDIWVDVKCFYSAGANFLAGTSQALYYSTNSGTNWNLAQPSGTPFIHAICGLNSKFFTGIDLIGVWYSTNYGVNWSQTALNNGSVMALQTFGNYIIAGTWSNGVYVSSNDGASWFQKNEGLNGQNIISLAISGNTIFAGTESNGILKRPLSEVVGIQNISNEIPSSYSLGQNYPNPFNPITVIGFQLPVVSDVSLKVYDIRGKEIQTLVNERLQPGTFEVTFNGLGLNSGVYFYKLFTNNYSKTKRMILIK
ncbi:MAG: T9SS type A sorting domain-containing protein [Ignavibacteria bacterium]